LGGARQIAKIAESAKSENWKERQSQPLSTSKHKVPPSYSRAEDSARSLNGRRDDDFFSKVRQYPHFLLDNSLQIRYSMAGKTRERRRRGDPERPATLQSVGPRIAHSYRGPVDNRDCGLWLCLAAWGRGAPKRIAKIAESAKKSKFEEQQRRPLVFGYWPLGLCFSYDHFPHPLKIHLKNDAAEGGCAPRTHIKALSL
jgi:hypothetical protein